MLNFRRALKPQQSILESLEEHGEAFFGKKMSPYFTDIIGEYMRVWHILENHKETLKVLQDTNTSLLTTKSNEVMQRLTIVAFIALPLTLVASVFGMNLYFPFFTNTQIDFWIVVIAMAISAISMFMYFKSKKWL